MSEKQSKPAGQFMTSLFRNNKQIRQDRAASIGEDAFTMYQRKVQDMERELRQLFRDQENMLDLSPTHAMSLQLASDFKGAEFVERDLAIGIKIYNLSRQLEVAKGRFAALFGNENPGLSYAVPDAMSATGEPGMTEDDHIDALTGGN
jgi:hypothetical protein